jgi:PAS domain S-box-containing protein
MSVTKSSKICDPVWSQNREHIEKLLLDEAAEISLLVDITKGLIIGIRGPIARIIGWRFDDIEGHEVWRLQPHGQTNPRVLAFGPALVSQHGYYGEVLVGCQNGSNLTMSVSVQPFRTETGELALVRLLDVTEQLQLTNELRRMHITLRNAYNLLERQGKSLDEARRAASLSIFAAGLAHELNNPISASCSNLMSLQSYVDDIAQAWVGEQAPEELAEIKAIGLEVHAELSRLAQIVARLGELELPVVPHEFDLMDILGEFCIQRQASICGPQKLPMHSDAEAIVRMLDKVMDNARAAAGRHGAVRLTVEHEGESARLLVDDSGSGIEERIIPFVFDPFFTTRPPGTGFGLGLFLARRTVSRLDGEISIENISGGGARVVIRLPINLPERQEERISYEGLRIK